MLGGAITSEKERDSLSMLFLAGMTSREILLQKFLGRLVPMLMFLMLILPLLAVCYAFGGLGAEALAAGFGFLLLVCLQVGSLSLAASAFFRTSPAAIIASYVLVAGFYLFFLPLIAESDMENLGSWFGYGYRGGRSGGFPVLLTILMAVSIGVSWLLAAKLLVRRSLLRPRGFLLPAFLRVDKLMERWNKRVGGIVLVRDRSDVPEEDPVAWRETVKRALGRPRHRIRLLLLLEAPLLLILAPLLYSGGSGHWAVYETTTTVTAIALVLAVLSLLVRTSSAFAAERSSQTLDTLLTTPLSGRDIVLQKMAGPRALLWLFLAPLSTIFLFEVFWYGTGDYGWSWRYEGPHQVDGYLFIDAPFFAVLSLGFCALAGLRGRWARLFVVAFFSAAAAFIPFRMAWPLLAACLILASLMWLACRVGLSAKNRLRAIFASLLLAGAWVILPFFLLFLHELLFRNRSSSDLEILCALLSPLTIFTGSDAFGWIRSTSSHFRIPMDLLLCLNLAVQAGFGLLLRHVCLRQADRFLGRSASGGRAPPAAEPAPAGAGP